MSAEKITEKILKKAQKEAEAVLEEARKKAEKIVKDAENRASEIEETARQEALSIKQREIEKILGLKKIEFKKTLLTEKRKLIDEVFERVAKKAKEDKELYIKLIEKAVSSVNFHGDETVIYSDDEVKKVLKSHLKSTKVKIEKGDVESGFKVKRGDIEMDFTIDFIVREASRELETEVARILFEK